MTFLLSTIYPSALVIISLPTTTFHLSCENIRFSSLLVAGDVSRGGKTRLPSGEERGETDVFAGYISLYVYLTSVTSLYQLCGKSSHALTFLLLGKFP